MFTSLALALITTNAMFVLIAGFAVILRLYARKSKSFALGADDYFIVAAWVISVALSVTNIIGVPVGDFGTPFPKLSPEKIVLFLKILFVMQFWYILGVALVKFSVLCFYGRIFSVGAFPVVIKLAMALSLGWLISFLFATLFQIWPISCNWVLYILLDIGILSIPVWFIRRLQMASGQKVGLAIVFGLGLFCVVSSVARMIYAIRVLEGNNNVGWANSFDDDIVSVVMWSGIETSASIVCANLPCYTGLVAYTSLQSFVSRFSSAFSARSRSLGISTWTKKSTGIMSASTENIVENGLETVIKGTREHGTQSDMEMGKIYVSTSAHHHEHCSEA